ncbi:MAG: hypothetical protein OSB12_07120, partial [Planctomycetota bacterium]|nr:hypothetical protein [Planctomycetota bacterium]
DRRHGRSKTRKIEDTEDRGLGPVEWRALRQTRGRNAICFETILSIYLSIVLSIDRSVASAHGSSPSPSSPLRASPSTPHRADRKQTIRE